MEIMNKLTIKHLLMNKKRTIVTIIGIILSTALMIGIGTFASSFRNYLIEDAKRSYGSQHVILKNIKEENLKYIEDNININKDKIKLEKTIGYAKINSINEYKPYLYILDVNNIFLNNITIVEGRLPKDNNEIIISEHTNNNGKANIQIGDTLNLSIGERIINDENGSYSLNQYNPFLNEETFNSKYNKEYTVVGIMERLVTEGHSAPGYTALTYNNIDTDSNYNVYIEYKKAKNITDKTNEIIKNLNLTENDVDYNNSLLIFYGASNYSGFNKVINNTLIIVLSLLVISCAIVIYNSFAISVMERKKQFGLISSIGATSKQIKRTVFFEAIIVSLIGIPIGIISGIGGIAITITIINKILTDMIVGILTLALQPFYIILPTIYMIITIFISAIIPAKRASKISPIELIRLNDDIKIKNKKLKTNKFINTTFGICGDIAYKNIKRNKKKYRITVISLFISIVLFISFSTFLSIGKKSATDAFYLENFDIIMQFDQSEKDNNITEIYNKIKNINDIDKISLIKNTYIEATFNKNNLTTDGIKFYKDYEIEKNKILSNIVLFIVSDKEYKDYINNNNIKNNNIIIINKLKYQDNNRKTYNIKPFKNIDNIEISYNNFEDQNVSSIPYSSVLSNQELDSLKSYELYSFQTIAFISNSMYENIKDNISNINTEILINTKEDMKVETEIKKIINFKNNERNSIYIMNYAQSVQQNRNIILIISILLYGFISLVTLIGITSVFNTINTSMALRKKEFAVLRSIGLSPKQFNKIILFESMLYGIKALLYALPVSMILVYIFNVVFNEMNNVLVIPYGAIIISIIFVFIITFITMKYATAKQRNENILDAIRNENI